MSFSALRNPLRRVAFSAAPARLARPQQAFRNPAFRRFNSTAPPPPPKSNNAAVYFSVAAVTLITGVVFYVYGNDASDKATTAAKSGTQAAKVVSNFVPSQEDYQKVYNTIAEMLDEAGEYDDGSYGPILLRLAWHCCGTYDKASQTGGSNYATMRFKPESLHSANNGLDVARALMENVKERYPWISHGDLWTLGGVAAIQEMAGPTIPWRPGRIDGVAAQATPDGRLPDASQGSDHLRKIFGRMGFNDQEIVALSGAHAIGRCHPDRSGFEGPWTFSPITLTNYYYKLLFEEKWVWRKWNGPKQLQDKKTSSLMMLPTDYVLTQDTKFEKHARTYAEDQDLFFKDFSAVVAKLFELGVPSRQWVTDEPWTMQTLEQQS